MRADDREYAPRTRAELAAAIRIMPEEIERLERAGAPKPRDGEPYDAEAWRRWLRDHRQELITGIRLRR